MKPQCRHKNRVCFGWGVAQGPWYTKVYWTVCLESFEVNKRRQEENWEGAEKFKKVIKLGVAEIKWVALERVIDRKALEGLWNVI